jgi:polyisoprenoid-binding protein YceI
MADMHKIISFLVVAALGVGAYVVLSDRDDRGPIGEPVLTSGSPEALPQASASAFTDGVYVLDAAASSMTWAGTKTLIKDYVDTGTIALSAGTTTVIDGMVASGSVTVDMTTIATKTTGKGDGQSMQERHIKGADFFDVEKYPTAVFALTALTPHAGDLFSVDGTLTVKGITKPVAFSATIRQDGDRLIMEARDVRLDRTEWDIRYASGKFFQGLGDKVIDDIFTVSFTAVGILRK